MKHLLILVVILIIVEANVTDSRVTMTSSDAQKRCSETCRKRNITCNLTSTECTDSKSANTSHVHFITTSNGGEQLCFETCTNLTLSCNLTSIECTESTSASRSRGSSKAWGYPGKRRRSLYEELQQEGMNFLKLW
ncbi:hypothetical protein CHS0354_040528 [Potamilus streckersoni]|uniref:Sodefrin-like factor n=1 Tax=Potamilus streckersoni TaxID=2493646 RepID=A0AAE0TK40_9BIVA|nr:hypothetical protein CHS0354_040528 [Potamilus streckersoni]